MRRPVTKPALLLLAFGPLVGAASLGQTIKLVERAPDPHGSPRPFRDALHVPTRTSLYLELAAPTGEVDPESVAVSLRPDGGAAVDLVRPGPGRLDVDGQRPGARIGGLELGAIFGTNLKLREFLAHCSPRARPPGASPRNAALADQRLDGKRSRRVEALCRAHDGKGSPCDFISIHSYDRSELMAAKLIRAKEMALEIDPDYYAKLWIDSHESCPDWMPPPDEAAADSYRGDGYFPGCFADVVHRQLLRVASDPRYAYGETILTVWPPPSNFAGLNAVTRILRCDDDGDGRADREVTVPMPIFHVLGMLSDLGDRYWVLPDRMAGVHVVSGFASRDDRGVVRVLLYAHDTRDTQSRSSARLDISLELTGLGGAGAVSVREHRFDHDHNSPFRRAQLMEPPAYSRAEVEEIRRLCECRLIGMTVRSRDADGRIRLTVEMAGNGCTFLVVESS